LLTVRVPPDSQVPMNYTRSTSPDWPAKSCSNLLNIGIWRSSISLPTIVQLYHTYIQPVLSYGSETLALIRSSGFRGGRAGSAPPSFGRRTDAVTVPLTSDNGNVLWRCHR